MNATQLTFGVAFLAGLASFLSPCVLPLVPIYLAQLVGQSVYQSSGDQEERPVRRARRRQDLHVQRERPGRQPAVVERYLYLGAFEAGGRAAGRQRDRGSSLTGRQHRGDDEREEQETGGHGEGRPQ